MKLDINEKRTIFHILVMIMEADFIIRPEEVEFLNNIFRNFELGTDEFDHMEELDIDNLSRDFAKFDKEKKMYAINLFRDMAKCDGYVDPRETAIIERLLKK